MDLGTSRQYGKLKAYSRSEVVKNKRQTKSDRHVPFASGDASAHACLLHLPSCIPLLASPLLHSTSGISVKCSFRGTNVEMSQLKCSFLENEHLSRGMSTFEQRSEHLR